LAWLSAKNSAWVDVLLNDILSGGFSISDTWFPHRVDILMPSLKMSNDKL
jgi:hypothetical protein